MTGRSGLRLILRPLAILGVLACARLASAQTAPPRTAAPPSRIAAALARWLDVQTASLAARYRDVETSADETTANQVQHQQQLRLRFKADARGRYSVHAGIFSGVSFGSSWNNTGIGTGEPVHAVHVKHLFADAMPLDGFEIQIGSLYFWRGESTEITSYDNDGYITGVRVSVKRPEALFVDELTYTQADLGDLDRVSAFARLDRIDDVTYRQVGAVKAFGKAGAASVDYTTHGGVRTLRAAVRVETAYAPHTPRLLRALRVVDRLRLETYRRLNDEEAGGFALAGEKAVTTRVSIIGGLTVIDEHLMLNGDRYGRGTHLFALGSVVLAHDWTLQSFVTRAIDIDFPVANKTRVDVVIVYNALKALQRARLLP